MPEELKKLIVGTKRTCSGIEEGESLHLLSYVCNTNFPPHQLSKMLLHSTRCRVSERGQLTRAQPKESRDETLTQLFYFSPSESDTAALNVQPTFSQRSVGTRRFNSSNQPR